MDKRIGPLPPRAALLLLYLVQCEAKGIKPNLDRRGRAINTLRSWGFIHQGTPKTTARARRMLEAWSAKGGRP